VICTRPVLIHNACASFKQKVDQQNSMDTAENDNSAEHSVPNSSEVPEVQT